jgi:hypothetical protein
MDLKVFSVDFGILLPWSGQVAEDEDGRDRTDRNAQTTIDARNRINEGPFHL